MSTWVLEYLQTPNERYATNMNTIADHVAEAWPGVRYVATFGGAADDQDPDEECAENALIVQGPESQVRMLAEKIGELIGKRVGVREEQR